MQKETNLDRKHLILLERERTSNNKKISILEKKIQESEKDKQRIIDLEKKVEVLEKLLLQTRSDFTRYRIRNKP